MRDAEAIIAEVQDLIQRLDERLNFERSQRLIATFSANRSEWAVHNAEAELERRQVERCQ